MAIRQGNPGIVTNGLQLYYNRESVKSFVGESTTNIVSNTTDFSGLSYAGYSTEWTSDPTRFTNLRTYADGVLDNTSGAITYSTTGQNNYIGMSNHAGNYNFFNGNMGLVQFYNRALSGAEVLQNYNATKGRYGR